MRTKEQTDRLRQLITVEGLTAKQVFEAMAPLKPTTLRAWWTALGIKPRAVTKQERHAINCQAHFTDAMRARVERVRELAPTKTAAEIAALIGSTPNAVRSLCSRHGILVIRVGSGRPKRRW